jgi:hypothetical protein
LGISTSTVFFLLLTAGLALGIGLLDAHTASHQEVQGSVAEGRDRLTDEVLTDIKILSFRTPIEVTYDFWTGQRVDKWAAEKPNELTNPPATGPFINDEVDLSDPYNDIRSSNNVWAEFSITNNRYGVHHFLFTINQNPSRIFNLSVLWEGYGEYGPSYVYIWNYASSAWELVGIGYSTSSDNVVKKDLTVNSATPSRYIDSSGYLHLIATTFALGGDDELRTDYVRVFVSAGGIWVKNTGEKVLDPDYTVLFDNYDYVDEGSYTRSVDGGYWEPGEVLRLGYNPPAGGRLFKVVAENGVADAYRMP